MTINLIYVLSQVSLFIYLTLFFLASYRIHIDIIKEAKVAFFRATFAYSTFLLYNLISRHILIVDLLFLNFCGSAIFNFKIQRLQLGSFSQNFHWILILLFWTFISIADDSFMLLFFDLALIVPFRLPWAPYEPFFVICFHFQIDGWISPKIIEILINAFKWILIKHK